MHTQQYLNRKIAPAIELSGVSKHYKGGVIANDQVDMAVHAGEIVGLLGHNGAGKTTLVRQVAGLAVPTEGRIRLGQIDPVAEPLLAREMVALQPQQQFPLGSLRFAEAVLLTARLRGASSKSAKRRLGELTDQLQLHDWLTVKGDRLSGGMLRLAMFCMAAAAPAPILVLDEPTNDVDPLRRQLLWEEVRRIADSGTAVLLVTHNVVEAERSVDRIAILDHGSMRFTGTPAELRETSSATGLRLEVVVPPHGGEPQHPLLSFNRIGRDRWQAEVPADQAPVVLEWSHEQVRDDYLSEYEIGPWGLQDSYLELLGARHEALT